jgi:hypothetical protein
MNKKCRHPESKLKRAKTYLHGDCEGYCILCKCGLAIGDWSVLDCEKRLEEERKRKKKAVSKCNSFM